MKTTMIKIRKTEKTLLVNMINCQVCIGETPIHKTPLELFIPTTVEGITGEYEITPTDNYIELNSVRCRLWKGSDEKGEDVLIPVYGMKTPPLRNYSDPWNEIFNMLHLTPRPDPEYSSN